MNGTTMTFEEFDAQVGKHKTGCYGRGVDMYTKRGGARERVFRVQWYERNSKYPTRDDFAKALRKQSEAYERGCHYPVGAEWVEHNETFPYTPAGLEAAIRFSESIEPKREAFANRK